MGNAEPAVGRYPGAVWQRKGPGRRGQQAGPGRNCTGGGELLDEVAAGRIKLGDVDAPKLPMELRKLPMDERQAQIEKLKKERYEVQSEIAQLAQRRTDYIAREQQRWTGDGTGDAFDAKVGGTLRGQAEKKRLTLEPWGGMQSPSALPKTFAAGAGRLPCRSPSGWRQPDPPVAFALLSHGAAATLAAFPRSSPCPMFQTIPRFFLLPLMCWT